ncbi:hypothetical protein [Psychrosphaera algicola]|uniref:Transposase n=1 Tax=Psychrosphaera algicola TaxID=3023714 RepID=A0ABT5FCJ6_9GAMM|nr:hypothetical protein [Psychrosphaera sp. G1-22]MDC2888759.1 hypothetical protein [Psychrosphaera sp. G1-22]
MGALQKNISEDIISDAFHTLDQSTAPFRWVMVDDGYLDAKNSKLLSFGVNKKKFANGWKPIMELKNEEKIKWVGIWRNFGGYMGGVSNDHTMSDLKPYLSPTVKKEASCQMALNKPQKRFMTKWLVIPKITVLTS